MEKKTFILKKKDKVVLTISDGEILILVNNDIKIKPDILDLKSLKNEISVMECLVI